ncbi:MAG: phenylalanine--tRNA ligase subunit beta [Candidatus Woykebacteria bacterium]
MLVPLSWLKDYVNLEENSEELAEKLVFSGTKIEEILKKEGETIFKLEITPNRADCLGIIGVAREVAALYERDLKIPQPFLETVQTKRKKSLKLTLKDPSLCPYYSLGVIDNVRVQESPDWLKKRLELAGIRAINNVVDITNYVMIETAQPMHAFDLDKVKGEAVLRSSRKGEKVTTLDGVERSLNEGAIIIEDSEKLIDLAGLMGGKNSQVDKDTSTIVLHVPVYNPVSIRKASQFTGLRTEASNRFEKILDPNAHRFAFERALHLLKVEAEGSLASEIKSVNYPVKSSPFTILTDEIDEILGVKIPEKDIVNILVNLGFEVLPSPSTEGHALEVRPPTWRGDVKTTEDIAEEVGRIWGYNSFPKTLPKGDIPTHEDSFKPDWERKIKGLLPSIGFYETYTHALISAQNLARLSIRETEILKVNNPMTVDFEYLRPTLLSGLLEGVSLNLRNFKDVSLFELGRAFSKKIDSKTKLPLQPKTLTAVSTSMRFSQMKGVVEEILTKLNIKQASFEILEKEGVWDKNFSAKISTVKDEVGIVGKIDSKITKNISIDKEVFGFEIDFDKLVKHASSEIKYKSLPKFPVVYEDLSILVDQKIAVQEILDTIESLKEKRLRSATIGEVIPWQENKKSILLHLEYSDNQKTLIDDEAANIRKKIVEKLNSNLDIELRSL